MNIGVCIVLLIILIIYYSDVLSNLFGTKYYDSPIKTKKDFKLALIPLFMWFKILYKGYKDLK